MMLMVTVIQVVCTIVAVYFGARTAMALGRDLRAGVFGKVETFAAREMAQLGAPTLITRTTNDVQQVQLIVFLALTLLVAAPDHVRRRHRHGAAPGRRAVVAAAARPARPDHQHRPRSSARCDRCSG